MSHPNQAPPHEVTADQLESVLPSFGVNEELPERRALLETVAALPD